MSDAWQLGQVVPLRFEVRDSSTGDLADPTGWALVVATPAGGQDDVTAGVTHDRVGVFDADYLPVVAGPHVAVFAATGVHAGTSTDVFLVSASAADLVAVTVAQLRKYLRDPSEDDDTLTSGVLDAERAAQARRCRIDPFTPDLREALLRRVARNLAARSVPVASFSTFEGGSTSTRVPQTDPEVARLEAPYRRRKVG